MKSSVCVCVWKWDDGSRFVGREWARDAMDRQSNIYIRMLHGFGSNRTFTVCFVDCERLAHSDRTPNEAHTVRLKSLSILRKCMDTTSNENIIFHITAIDGELSHKRRYPNTDRATWHFFFLHVRTIPAPAAVSKPVERVRASERTIDANFTFRQPNEWRFSDNVATCCIRAEQRLGQQHRAEILFQCPRTTSNFGIKRNWYRETNRQVKWKANKRKPYLRRRIEIKSDDGETRKRCARGNKSSNNFLFGAITNAMCIFTIISLTLVVIRCLSPAPRLFHFYDTYLLFSLLLIYSFSGDFIADALHRFTFLLCSTDARNTSATASRR